MPHPEKLTASWVESWEKLLAGNLPFKIFLKGRDLTYLACNENYAADHGMKPSEIFGRSDYDLYPPELAEKYRADDLRILETGRSETIEEHYVRDGQEFHVQTIESLFRDQSDEVIGILGTFWDITDPKRAEEALKKSTQLLRDTGEMAKVGGWELDLSTQEVSWTEEVGRIHGVEPGYRPKLEEALNFYAPESRQALKEALKKAAKTGEPYDLESLVIPSGSKDRIWVRSLGRAVTSDGKITKLAGTFQNIDRYKRAEEALRKSEEKYRALVENANEAIIVTQDGALKFANPKAGKLLGYSLEEAIGQPFIVFIYPDDRLLVTERYWKRLGGEVSKVVHPFRAIHKDGSIRWEEINSVLIAWEDRPAIMSYLTDITERKRAEDALRESEVRYRELFENINSGVAVYTVINNGQDFIFKDFNRAGERIDQDQRERLIGKSIFEVRPGIEQFGLIEVFRQVWQTGKPAYHPVTFYQDNKLSGWYENFVYKLPSGEIVAVFEDITERKQAEEALRESEEKFSKSFHLTPLSMAISSASDRRYIEINDAFLSLTGYSREEVIGRNSLELGLWTDAATKKHVNHELAGAGETHNVPVRLRTKSGEIREAVYSAATVSLGGVPHVVAQVLDITERKRVEKALQESEEKYRVLVENANEVIIVTQDGVLRFANARASELFGYSLEEAVGRAFVEFIHPDDRLLVAERYQKRLDGEVPTIVYPFRTIQKDGSIRWAEINSVLIAWEDRPAIMSYLTDITERKRVEESLRESEAKYRSLVETAIDGVASIDLNGNLTFINDALCRITGYTQDELLNKPFAGVLHPDDLPALMEAFLNAAIGTMSGPILEFRAIQKTGQSIWFSTQPTAILIDGKAIGFNAILHNISKRKRVEKSLRESEAKYRLLADNTVDGVWLLDMNLKLIYCSPSSEKQSGFTLQEIMEMSLEQYFTPESLNVVAEAFMKEMPKVEADPDYNPILTLDLEFCKKDGTAFWAESKFSIVRDQHGKPISILGQARDITERKQMEEALRESEHRLASIIDFLPDATFAVNLKGEVIAWNLSMEELTGAPKEELIGKGDFAYAMPFYGKTIPMLIDMIFQDWEKIQKNYDYLIKREDQLVAEAFVPALRDGKGAYLWGIASPLYDSNGSIVGAIESLRDIGERKQLEEGIRQARTDLLFAVSHDMKTPLMVLNQSQEMLNVLEPGKALDHFQDYRQIWRRNLQRLERMINNLVDSQRSEEGRFPLLLAPCRLEEMVKRVVEDSQGYAQAKLVEVKLELQPVPEISCEEEAIARVVENLLTNAVKFSPKRGRVEIRLGMDGNTLRLEVEDRGCGIPKAEQEQLFQPFQRGRLAHQKGIPGTGLGLYVCRRIVEAHGGSISLQSTEGVGTTVTVTLPYKELPATI
ncbi:MAG: PAS domain S-box protein [Coprothermobacterota bacterium]|nr:PAS domain S-box protein [Coprothermobacterota bacterium]